MKFLCLGYLNSAKMDASPKEKINAVMSECPPHLEKLYESGQVILDVGLTAETICLRQENGQVEVMDGPLIETQETIGSAFIIEAKDMEEAIQIASLHPTLQVSAGEQFGWRVEISPIHYFENFSSP
ncbi:YciI family protein [Paenibacillus sp. sgz500958]|uniref:YciI family protein n=1 Tax=Paenibacillus sp. sgz500958 TaxID=3242475 RepID=UPI0036D3FC10